MRTSPHDRHRERGFSLVEMMVVVGIGGVLAAMMVIQIEAARPGLRGDGAMRVILGQMRMARERAITERRYMRVTFPTPNRIDVLREEVPGPATTLVSSTVLEGGVIYTLMDGVPNTPDSFGFGSAIDFGVVTNVKFSPDGTLVNQDGASTNGSVFLAVPELERSARAITVLGSTGRVRAFRWDGRNWKLV